MKSDKKVPIFCADLLRKNLITGFEQMIYFLIIKPLNDNNK